MFGYKELNLCGKKTAVAMRLFWVLMLLFCELTRTLRLPDLRLFPRCPSSYTIQNGNSPPLEIKVKNSTNACERLPTRQNNEEYPTDNKLTPVMTLGSYGNQKVVNITWNATIIGNKYPKMYLLELTIYDRSKGFEVISTSCVLLRLKNRKAEASTSPPTLFFDCVELVPEKDILLGVQVWCLPDSKSALKSCQTRRHKRALPPTTCRNIRGQIHCSEAGLFPLSLDDHIPFICHCSERPNLSITSLENGSLKIDIWNLPQFAFEVVVSVVKNENKMVFQRTLRGTDKFNESRSVITDKAFGPGNYTPVVEAKCAEPDLNNDWLKGYNCPNMDVVQSEFPLEVTQPLTTRAPEFRPEVHTVVPILVVLAVSCLFTLIVFYIRQILRKRKKRRHAQSEAIPLTDMGNRNNESTYLRLAKMTSEKMLIYHKDSESHLECISALKNLCKSFELTLVTDITIDSDTANISANPDTSDTLHNGTTTTTAMTAMYDKVTTVVETSNASDTTSTIANHNATDTTTPIHDKGINTTTMFPNANWRDFAEMAGTRYTEIVFVMSPRLLQLCRTFPNKFSDPEGFEALRRERHYDLIPCVVLEKLRTLIQENAQNCNFSVHLVSLDSDNSLSKEFLNMFDFLKRCPNCFPYHLSEFNRVETIQEFSVQLNKTDLKQLLRRLKGLTEDEMWNSGIDLAIQTFGMELSLALSQR